ncbi:glycosyltransferase family 2 protein [Pseudarthrobacter sp. NamE5]|uniref:glycosyltransferase family 2 protein n=1 Tax=Pseudarthrobacter sp. NamE5 TaxID=2576839 RepID=UPI00110B31EF|nr:glycosyltransferase family 2 protein [Pseudarthrobacter sp. NamE5]TLM81687.1 glycosyltransferase [Pseudarthrobacter sp. NamE5]
MLPTKTIDVSVVIPSVGRPELRKAVESVIAQDYSGGVEVLVVFDRDEAKTTKEMLEAAEGAHRVLFTGGGKRGGFARNLGVRSAQGKWIAFLDDDDTWFPEKLRIQLAAASRFTAQGALVIGSRAVQSVTGTTSTAKITGVPAVLIHPDQDIASYLFRRRRAGSTRASFFASTVMAPKELCTRVPWDEKLTRHQDWDWLLKLGREADTQFIQAKEELVDIYVGTAGSISAGSDWVTSLEWAKSALGSYGAQTEADFLAGQTLRYALQKHDLKGVLAIIRRLIGLRRFPSVSPLALGISGVLPRTWIQRLMRFIK